MKNEKFRNLLICLSLFIITLSTRLLIAPGNNSYASFDAGNYSLAVISYSIEKDRPHFPGYYLYVQLIKIIYQISNSFYYSLLYISILFTSLASIFIYLIFKSYYKKIYSILLTLIVLFNPLVLFYGTSTEIYAFDLLFSSLIFYVGLQKNGIYFLPLLIALGSGIRQTSGMLLLPLCLYILYRKFRDSEIEWNLLITSLIPAILAFLLWFIPMTNNVGGISNYLDLSINHNPVPRNLISDGFPSFARNLIGISSFGIFIAIPSITTFLLLLINKFFWKTRSSDSRFSSKPNAMNSSGEGMNQVSNQLLNRISLIKIGLWLIPPLLFFIIIYYAKGYFLLVFPIIIFIPAYYISRKLLGIKSLILIIIIQITVFFTYPFFYPDYEDNSNYKYRTLSKAELSIDRLFSYYSMSFSHLKNLELYYNEIDSLFNKPNISSDSYIIIDPSVLPNQRVLQIIYPSRIFLKFDHTKKNQYWLYHGIESYTLSDYDVAVKCPIIVSSQDFFKKYFLYYAEQSFSTSHFILFRPKLEHIGKVLEIYDKFFLKIDYS